MRYSNGISGLPGLFLLYHYLFFFPYATASSSSALSCVKESISPYLQDTLCDVYELRKGKHIHTGYVSGVCCEPWISSSSVITLKDNFLGPNTRSNAFVPPTVTKDGTTIDYSNFSIPVKEWNIPFGCRICSSEPILDNHYVSRSFYIETTDPDTTTTTSPKTKVKLFGHYATLGNPIDHFSILVPKNSCNTTNTATTPNLYLPREIIDQEAHWSRVFRIPRNLLYHKRYQQYTVQIRSHTHGCRVATNGGLFNTQTGACYGNIISNNKVRNFSKNRNVHLGYYSTYETVTKNGNNDNNNPKNSLHYYLVTGYFSDKDKKLISDHYDKQPFQPNNNNLSSSNTVSLTAPRFDQLIGGATWLVRNGTNYALTSALQIEDSNVQETSNDMRNFALTLSGRTAIGIDRTGQLILAQLDGRSWWNGINLPTFADWLIGLGVNSAINLDGGGSTVWLSNNEIINNPTYSCPNSSTDDSSSSNSKVTPKPSSQSSKVPSSRRMRGTASTKINEETNKDSSENINQDGSNDRNYHCPRKLSSLVCIHSVPRLPTIVPSISLLDEDYDEGTMVKWDEWKILLTNGCICQEEKDTDPVPIDVLYSLLVVQTEGSGLSNNRYRRLRQEKQNNQLCLCTPPNVQADPTTREHYTVSITDNSIPITSSSKKAFPSSSRNAAPTVFPTTSSRLSPPSSVPSSSRAAKQKSGGTSSTPSSAPYRYDEEDDTMYESITSSTPDVSSSKKAFPLSTAEVSSSKTPFPLSTPDVSSSKTPFPLSTAEVSSSKPSFPFSMSDVSSSKTSLPSSSRAAKQISSGTSSTSSSAPYRYDEEDEILSSSPSSLPYPKPPQAASKAPTDVANLFYPSKTPNSKEPDASKASKASNSPSHSPVNRKPADDDDTFENDLTTHDF